jgi:hypothetical protein
MANLSKFQKEIEKHLIDFKSNNQYLPPTNKKEWLYHDMSDNLFPPIKHGFLQYAYDSGMPLHDFVNHVRSSQMFCINLFYHLIKNEPQNLLKTLSHLTKTDLVKIKHFEFEFSPETNILGEWKSDQNRPEEYITATDLFLKVKNASDKTVGFLIEIKFTEKNFTNCGGYNSNGNSKITKIACNDANILFTDFKSCYLHGALGESKLCRKYLDYFETKDFVNERFSGKCPFISNNQCIRNHSLLRSLCADKKIDYGFFVLAHYDLNESIVDEWKLYKDLLSETAQEEIYRIKASDLIKGAKNENFKKYFHDRYLI